MASGHVNRIKRPNTWLHRPMLQNVKKALANSEPSTHGTSRRGGFAQYPLQAQGAGPAFLAGHVPERFEPQTQRQMRVREQGPRCHRSLQTAPPAVTQAPRCDPMIRPLACRTAKPFRPPQPSKIVSARHIVRETIAKLQHRPGILRHDPATTNCATGVKCIALLWN